MEDKKNNEILMILPRRTVYSAGKLPKNWELDQDATGLSISVDEEPTAYAFWKDAEDFGVSRPAIKFYTRSKELKSELFKALMKRLALAYDGMPSKYPLYIRLHEDDLELIAEASRIGFVPYFGTWKKKSAEQSENSWKKITDLLRIAYPAPATSLMA